MLLPTLPRRGFYLQVYGPLRFFSSPTSYITPLSAARGPRSLWSTSPLNVDFSPVSPFRTFSGSAMAGAKIDGTAIAKSIRQGLKAEIEQLQVTNPRFKPNLIIFQGKQYPSRV